MTVVADSSVIVSALAGSRRRGSIARDALRRAGRLHAPHLLDLEVSGALRGLARGGRLPAAEAAAALQRYTGLRLRRHVHRALLPRVWELRENLTSYDACYVALAEALGTRLLTEDVRIAKAPGISCPVEVLEG